MLINEIQYIINRKSGNTWKAIELFSKNSPWTEHVKANKPSEEIFKFALQ